MDRRAASGKGRSIESGQRDALTARAIRMYARYGDELESLRQLLHMRLSQVAAAYTLHQRLPARSVRVESRVKALSSFLHKLELRGWPAFYYPEEVIFDLLGGRFVCWFLDDCYGILDALKEAEPFTISAADLEDYVREPKPSGYRSIHLLARMACDRVHLQNGQARVGADSALVEIQMRTELQHFWADITQDIHRERQPVPDPDSDLITSLAGRLAAEDSRGRDLRAATQRLWADAARRRLDDTAPGT